MCNQYFILSLPNLVCFLYTHRISQLKLATSQVFSSHMKLLYWTAARQAGGMLVGGGVGRGGYAQSNKDRLTQSLHTHRYEDTAFTEMRSPWRVQSREAV